MGRQANPDAGVHHCLHQLFVKRALAHRLGQGGLHSGDGAGIIPRRAVWTTRLVPASRKRREDYLLVKGYR